MRLPIIQEFDDVLRPDSNCGFEFPLLLANDEFTVGIEDGQAGNSLFERDFVFLREIEVLVIIPDVHMNHVVVIVNDRGDFLRMECSVQNVAVVAPIPAKDEENALVVFRGCRESCSDLRAGLYPSGILRRIAGDRVSYGGHGAAENFLAIDQSLDAGFNLNSKIDSIYLLQLLL